MRRMIGRRAKTVAVLGSVAVLGGGATALAATSTTHTVRHDTSQSGPPAPMANLTSGEQTALDAVQKAIAAQRTAIATPILDSAVSAGTITAAQEQDLLTLLSKGPIGPGPGGPWMHPGPGGGMPPASATG